MPGRRILCSLTVLTAAVFMLCSCGGKKVGYGVMLWSADENQVATGSVVPVYEDSSIRDSYIIGTADEERTEVPRFRLAFFDKEKEASEYAAEYEEYCPIFAKTLKDGLAIRIEKNELSERVYKLREGQIVKVLEKISPRDTVGDHEDYWYRVMTEDGVAGYCFGYNIDIYDKTRRGSSAAVDEIDPKLKAFLNRPYRPEYYKTMLDEHRVDLTLFTAEIGVFPNMETRSLRIVLPKKTYTIEYEGIQKTGGDRYVFTGSTLEVITLTMNKIVLSSDAGEIDGNYYYIEGIDDIRTAEEERRSALAVTFQDLGTLSSGAYGTLSFEEENRFVWRNYERLVPTIIPIVNNTGGVIRFDSFLTPELLTSHDGAISFVFDDAGGKAVCFLYTLTDTGLRLVYAPPEDMKDGVVVKENASPIVLIFSP